MIIGHQPTIDALTNQYDRGVLSHAVGLFGPEQVGKMTIVRQLVAHMQGILPEQIDHHPDVLIVDRGFDEKTKKTKQHITVEQIRQVAHRAYQKPLSAQHVIIVINNAHLMHPSASNALLKVLEEPASTTHFFLLTDKKDHVLATIQSRTAMIHVPLVQEDQIHSSLIALGASPEQAAVYARAAHGRPGRALTFFHDTEAFSTFQTQVDRCLSLCHQPFYVQIEHIESLFGDKKDAIGTRAAIIDELAVWQQVILDLYQDRVTYSTKQVPPALSARVTTALYDTIQTARTQLAQNIHPRLLVEHILLAFSSNS